MDNPMYILTSSIVEAVKAKVWGYVKAYYNAFTDTLEIKIENRALKSEPFRYSFSNFSSEVRNGTSATVIAKFILKEYGDYISMYFWKRG